jgi:hypothetical protein
MVTEIFLMIAIGLNGLAILLMIVFGIKNLTAGKHEVTKLVISASPFVILGVTYLLLGDSTAAAMATMLVMLAFVALFLLVSGLRSSFKI